METQVTGGLVIQSVLAVLALLILLPMGIRSLIGGFALWTLLGKLGVLAHLLLLLIVGGLILLTVHWSTGLANQWIAILQ